MSPFTSFGKLPIFLLPIFCWLATPQTPPAREEVGREGRRVLGFVTPGKRHKIWEEKERINGQITLPKPDNTLSGIADTIGKIEITFKKFSAATAVKVDVKRKVLIDRHVSRVLESLEEVKELLKKWEKLGYSNDAKPSVSGCVLTLEKPTIMNYLTHAEEDALKILGMEPQIDPSKQEEAYKKAAFNKQVAFTVSCLLYVLGSSSELEAATTELRELIEIGESLSNFEVPQIMHGKLNDETNCLASDQAEQIKVLSCHKSSEGMNCPVEIIKLKRQADGFTPVGLPFLKQSSEAAGKVLKLILPDVLVNKAVNNVLDLERCEPMSAGLLCPSSIWETDDCLDGLTRNDIEKISSNCIFSPSKETAKPFVENTELGILVSPRSKGEVTIDWTQKNPELTRTVVIKEPTIFTGSGQVEIRWAYGKLDMTIVNTKANTDVTKPEMLIPKQALDTIELDYTMLTSDEDEEEWVWDTYNILQFTLASVSLVIAGFTIPGCAHYAWRVCGEGRELVVRGKNDQKKDEDKKLFMELLELELPKRLHKLNAAHDNRPYNYNN